MRFHEWFRENSTFGFFRVQKYGFLSATANGTGVKVPSVHVYFRFAYPRACHAIPCFFKLKVLIILSAAMYATYHGQ